MNAQEEGEILYRVVFSGKTTEEYDLKTTRRRFAKAFRLNSKKTDQLFSGKNHVIKSNLAEQGATEFAMKLVEIGCECYVEEMPDPNDPVNQPGFVERRRRVRRVRFRRGTRSGSIKVDRRVQPSRRKSDLETLAKNGDFPGNSIKASA